MPRSTDFWEKGFQLVADTGKIGGDSIRFNVMSCVDSVETECIRCWINWEWMRGAESKIRIDSWRIRRGGAGLHCTGYSNSMLMKQTFTRPGRMNRMPGLIRFIDHNWIFPSVNQGGEILVTDKPSWSWWAVVASKCKRASTTLLSSQGMWKTCSWMFEAMSKSIAVMSIGLYAERAWRVLNISKVFELSVKIAKQWGFGEMNLQTWLRAERTVRALKKNIPFQVLGKTAHTKLSQVVRDQYPIPDRQALLQFLSNFISYFTFTFHFFLF
jgi:hypothetical protein